MSTTLNTNSCVFCGDALAGKRSREHVIPQWLLDHLAIRDNQITPTHYSALTGKPLSTRKHTLDGLVAGHICQDCNSGWMSKLEEHVKDKLIALISDDMSVVDLEAAERISVARWAAKTCYTLNLASNYHKNIPLGHYRYLHHHSDSLPPGVGVFAQQHHCNLKFYWIQQAEWELFNSSKAMQETRKILKRQAYKITLQFGKLLLIVAHLPQPPLQFVIWSGIHVPLWPHHGPVGWFERDNFPWNDSLKAVHAFHAGLQAVHEN